MLNEVHIRGRNYRRYLQPHPWRDAFRHVLYELAPALGTAVLLTIALAVS